MAEGGGRTTSTAVRRLRGAKAAVLCNSARRAPSGRRAGHIPHHLRVVFCPAGRKNDSQTRKAPYNV